MNPLAVLPLQKAAHLNIWFRACRCDGFIVVVVVVAVVAAVHIVVLDGIVVIFDVVIIPIAVFIAVIVINVAIEVVVVVTVIAVIAGVVGVVVATVVAVAGVVNVVAVVIILDVGTDGRDVLWCKSDLTTIFASSLTDFRPKMFRHEKKSSHKAKKNVEMLHWTQAMNGRI